MIVLKAELGHLLEVISQATGRAMGVNVAGTFEPCEDYASGKAKKDIISEKAV